MARIGIIGCEGAMGHALAAVIGASGHELAGGIDKGGDAAGLADASEVLVDFSTPGALCINLHAAIGAGVPLVIGTTGLEERHHAAIDDAARAVPVLQTGNTSLGVTLLAHLVREAAARLLVGRGANPAPLRVGAGSQPQEQARPHCAAVGQLF